MTGLIVDGCAGPGGFDLGAQMLGLDPIGFEWDKSACATRAAAGLRTVRVDVTQVDPARMAGKVEGILFSPPCQAFSAAGKGGGKQDMDLIWQALDDLARGADSRAELAARAADPRSLVVAEPLRWVLAARPEWTVWEQVPPVLPVWDECALILRGIGYQVWTGVLNAANYGVPQTRQRAFLLARRGGPVSPPPPTHSRDPWGRDLFGGAREPWVSMAEALGMDGVNRVRTSFGAPSGERGGHHELDPVSRPAHVVTGKAGSWVVRTEQNSDTSAGRVPIERRSDQPAPTLVANADRWELRNNTQDNAATRGLDEPAPTMFFGARRPGHKDCAGGESQFEQDSVRISVEQAAVLQSFPPDYPFQGTKTAQFRQVGDAVPPLLAAHCIAAAAGIGVLDAWEVAAA